MSKVVGCDGEVEDEMSETRRRWKKLDKTEVVGIAEERKNRRRSRE